MGNAVSRCIAVTTVIDGENAVRLGLSNQHEDFLYDDAGNNKTGNVTSQATVYDGASPVSASDVTWAIVSDQSKTYGVPTSGANVPTLVNGLLTVKALTANTAKVTIKATYPKTNGRDYFAEFTANKRTQDVYNLDIQPNIISYNTSNTFSPTTITIKAHRVSIDGSQADITTFNSDLLYLAAYLKSGSTFAWHTIGTNGTISPAQTVCAANDNILIELRKVKDGATYSVSDPSTYTVEDFQTIDIAKYQNGANGTKFQRIYRSLNDYPYPYSVPEGNTPAEWSTTPTAISSTARYRYVSERTSEDGGATWTWWSTPQVDAYMPEDGRSISIRGSVIDVHVSGTYPQNPQIDDIVLENGTEQCHVSYYDGSGWQDGMPDGSAVNVGEGFILKSDGHLWVLKTDSYVAGRWEDVGQIKGDPGPEGPAGKDSAVVRFSPSTVFVPADSEGVADVLDLYVDLWLELNGTNIGFDGSPTIVSDPKSIASYDSGEGKIQIWISDLTPAEDYEGEVIVSLTKTYGGKTYSATGSLPVVAQIRGANGQSPIHYSLEASINNVHWGDDYAGTSKAFTPTSLNLKLTKYVGNTATVLSTLPNGYYLYYYGYNGDTLKKSGSDTLGAHNVSNYFCYTENQNTFVCDKLECILCTDSTKPASPANAHNVIGDVVVTSTRDIYRMLIPAGTYQSQLYTRDDSTTPLVYDQTSGFYWYLDADSNQTSQGYEAPSNASTCWKRATNNFQVILTQMLFTEFARMGGFIVYNNFFISQYGTLVGNNTADIKVNAANVNTQYTANKGGVSFTSVPYGWFDGNDPMGETATSGTTYKFRPMKVVNALTGEEWMAEGKVHVSSKGDLEIKGALMAHRVLNIQDYINKWNYKHWAGSPTATLPDDRRIYGDYMLYDYEPNTQIIRHIDADEGGDAYNVYGVDSCGLLYDQILISAVCDLQSEYIDPLNMHLIDIFLPSPHRFIGQSIVITNDSDGFDGENTYGTNIKLVLQNVHFTDLNECNGYCLTGPETYFFVDYPAASYPPELHIDGTPLIFQDFSPKRIAGIWKSMTLHQGSSQSIIPMPVVEEEVIVNEYNWLELTAVKGNVKDSYPGMTGRDLQNCELYNAYWMITRWEKKPSGYSASIPVQDKWYDFENGILVGARQIT